MKKKKLKTNAKDFEIRQPKEALKKQDSFYAWDGETLILNVLGKPASKRDIIGKVLGSELKISVREIPDEGKATDYMVRFLAREFSVSIKDIEVVFGRFSIHKQLRIKGPRILPPEIPFESRH
jgi:uncharacterized protein (TIGR00251 family)